MVTAYTQNELEKALKAKESRILMKYIFFQKLAFLFTCATFWHFRTLTLRK